MGGALPELNEISIRFEPEFWQGRRESNPRHAVLETAALPLSYAPMVFKKRMPLVYALELRERIKLSSSDYKTDALSLS